MTEKLKIFATTVEDTARAQIDEMNECEAYRDCTVRIMPDCHAGKGCTIGTVIEVKDRIVPNTVGVDIGCGMMVCEIMDNAQRDLGGMRVRYGKVKEIEVYESKDEVPFYQFKG